MGSLSREEGVSGFQALWRKQEHVTVIERPNLLWRATDRSGRSDDFCVYRPSVILPATQCINRAFVHPDHRPERTGNQVELVLNDEIRWRSCGADAEKRPSLRVPWEQRE